MPELSVSPVDVLPYLANQVDLSTNPVEIMPYRVVPAPEPAALEPASDTRPPPKKRSRRSRPLEPPFNVILYGQSGRKMDVRLDVPSADEECPLTLAPIADDTLEFLQPTTTWFVSFPHVKKMVLPCGHGFGALNILYHFARRNMLCPCCRAGLDSKLNFRCVPAMFRSIMQAKINRESQADEQELIESDRRVASSLQSQAEAVIYTLDVRFLDFILSGSLSLNIRFYTYNSNRPPLATLNLPLLASVNSNDLSHSVFTLPRGSISDFLGVQLRDPSACAVDFAVVADFHHATVQTASTGVAIQLDRQSNRELYTIPAEGNSLFTIEFVDGHSRIVNFEWKAPVSFLSALN